jgi:hypothetical protein
MADRSTAPTLTADMSLSRHKALAALTLVALPALTVPATAAAQDSAATTRVTARTHTVRRGDTLWDLSGSYLNNPFLWPEIYRLNTDVIENPHWIYPGERLALPDAAAGAAAAAAPDDAPVFSQTSLTTRSPVAPERMEPVRTRFAAVRPGEVDAAPFVDRVGGPANSGRIVQSAAESSVRASLRDQALLLNDEVYVTLPSGSTARVGDRYLAYALGAELETLGQVVVPTGVLRIDRVDAAGAAPRARLTRQFGRVVAGQRLLPLASELPATGAAPSAVEEPVNATVVWIPNDPVLASVQRYVVLDAPARRGTRVGDQFTLVRPRQARTEDAPALPEEEIAVAQVVRVTPYAATAIVVSQTHPAIRRGTRARVSAKMP